MANHFEGVSSRSATGDLDITILVISLLKYSAMAGVVGGGLGDLAIRYGYQRFDTRVMIVTVVLLMVLVQLT